MISCFSSFFPDTTQGKSQRRGLASTAGDFGNGFQAQCTGLSKRSMERCKGPAVAGDPRQLCRMHAGGDFAFCGAGNPMFVNGRYSKFLPAKLGALYEEAVANPDLIDLSDHIALLEARVQDVLLANIDGDPVPKWGEVKEMFDNVATAALGGDADRLTETLAAMYRMLESGEKWDQTWAEVQSTLEQLRKLTDTDIKRRKELNQMVPVERVVALMAAVGMAVKRNVKDPAEIEAVYRDLALLHTGERSPGNNQPLISETAIDVSPESRGIGGGASKEAMRRKRNRARKAVKAVMANAGD